MRAGPVHTRRMTPSPEVASSLTPSAHGLVERGGRQRRWGPDVASGLLVLGAALLLAQMRGLSFFQDEWDFTLRRPGFSAHALLIPHNVHLSLVPILIYKAMLAVFGADTYTPFKLLAALNLVVVAAAVGFVVANIGVRGGASRRWRF